ncbi:hypothetical protein NX722_00945 [Endozoicomonas gorgoniicola]|uniref:Uncharacterized protein n=1 Tax=Endozoicomonas gorgoniicola TaxID=1234144 RepID=A0ABT3MPD3_9GAMM|nr:hypothetical protein [Endozoicomonas gorgoniicola]MCW7551229.1 hypothetical protein [Endozoicomonas gorgoniicola]
MALFPKCLRQITTLIIVLNAATSGFALAHDGHISATTFQKVSKKHADCHTSMQSIAQTNQAYLPPGLRCITTTETPTDTIVEQSTFNSHGIEYDCSLTSADHSNGTLLSHCNGIVQANIPNATPAKRQYHAPGHFMLERRLPEYIEIPYPNLPYILLASKRLAIDYAYYFFGNGFELYYHFKKIHKIWRRYSKSLKIVASQVKTINSLGVRHRKNPAQQLWIKIIDSSKFFALQAWNLYEIQKHMTHFLNIQHTHQFSEGETTIQVGSAAFELYEENDDFLEALKSMPTTSRDSLEDLALYTLIVYNGYEAINGMPEGKSITSYLYKLAQNGALYLLAPGSRYRDYNNPLKAPPGVSSQPAVRGPELTVPLVRSYHDIRYY